MGWAAGLAGNNHGTKGTHVLRPSFSSGTHRQNAPMTVIVTSPCLLQLQCIHRSTLPITDMSHCHEVILTDVQPCPR